MFYQQYECEKCKKQFFVEVELNDYTWKYKNEGTLDKVSHETDVCCPKCQTESVKRIR